MAISRDPAAQRVQKPPPQPGRRHHSSAVTTHGLMNALTAVSPPPAFTAAASAAYAACAPALLQTWSPCGKQASIRRSAAYSSHLHSYSSALALVGSGLQRFWEGPLQTGIRHQQPAPPCHRQPTSTALLSSCRCPSQRSCRLIGVCCRLSHAALPLPACRRRSLPHLPPRQPATGCGRFGSGHSVSQRYCRSSIEVDIAFVP